LQEDINRLVASRRPVLVWGAGSLARRLLSSSRLAEANIAAFIDANPHLREFRLAGREILAPDQVEGRSEMVVVCAGPFAEEIIREARARLGEHHPLMILGRTEAAP
jgi:FlaA1/EpsC-like NDP-sugar epimerase